MQTKTNPGNRLCLLQEPIRLHKGIYPDSLTDTNTSINVE